MDWLQALPTTGITAVSLFILMYVAQLRGWFYTKPQVDELRVDRDNRITELREMHESTMTHLRETNQARLDDRNEVIENLLKAIAEKDAALEVSRMQLSRLLDGVETTAAVVSAIPRSVDQ